MNPFEAFTVRPLDHRFHDGEGGFHEQMSVLYLVGDVGDYAGQMKFVRSFLTVCQPGASGFDPNNPGMDTADGWQVLDSLIENAKVRGDFHTHPPGAPDFSSKDWRTMRGLAQANGSMPLWHGVQAVNENTAHFVCLRMLAGRIHCYDLGWFASDLNDPVVLLPAPPQVVVENNMVVMRWITSHEFADLSGP